VSAHSLLTLFLKTCKAAGFFRSPEAIGFVPSNPHKIRIFRRFQALTKAIVGHPGKVISNDSKCGCPQGHVCSNLTASANLKACKALILQAFCCKKTLGKNMRFRLVFRTFTARYIIPSRCTPAISASALDIFEVMSCSFVANKCPSLSILYR